jgi:hypothetical protein
MSAGKARSFAFSDEGDDPFALEHISEHHDCPAIESTYRNSGLVLSFLSSFFPQNQSYFVN